MKACSTCRSVLETGQFYADARRPDGLKSQCKKCHSECSVRTRNRETKRATNRESARRLRSANPERFRARERLAEERERAESRKRDGKLPRPSSSYQVEHDAPANGIPSRASVREVGPEDELDFEASA